jgi:hypothetical protein
MDLLHRGKGIIDVEVPNLLNVIVENFRFTSGVFSHLALRGPATAEMPNVRLDDVEGVKRQLLKSVEYLRPQCSGEDVKIIGSHRCRSCRSAETSSPI